QWLYFIKWAGSLEDIPERIRGAPIRHAFEKARVANMSMEEYELYEKAGMALTDARGALQEAREEGEKAGLEKGRQQGEQVGLEKGLQMGEHKTAIATLRRLLQRKFGLNQQPAWLDQRLAGASLEQIETWTDRILEAGALEDVFAIYRGPDAMQ
ncbi:MAG: hypothetical protein HQL82_12825, partial [Magnetococcales bacterium]|nr:hypothetical protein [Magnetococcales bacterium]